MQRKGSRAACGLVLAAAVAGFASGARGDGLSFGQPSQNATAQDDLNSVSNNAAGFVSNSASTMDGDGFQGFASVDVEQSVSFDAPSRTLAASAQVSVSATGPAFGGDFSASGQASYSVPFTLSGPQDVIFADSGGESTLSGPNDLNLNPGPAFLQAGDYTLAGSELALATGSDGATSQRNNSFDASVKFILPGDVNQDGSVNFADLLALAQHYGQSNATLADGDINLDGSVGFADLLLLAQNYGQAAGQPALAAVPEPTALGILALAPALLRRRRR